MSVLEVVNYGDPILRKKCQPVNDFSKLPGPHVPIRTFRSIGKPELFESFVQNGSRKTHDC